MRLTFAVILSFAAASAAAKDFAISPPVACGAEGDACIIQQYVDTDPTEGFADFTCGPLTYDGHKGTDFRVATLNDMERGVDVLAVAPGTVTAIRDGMVDIASNAPDAPSVSNRECGNGLVIDHGDGWETQYCHLRNGSVSVAAGQEVSGGTVIGQIGLSGRTEFPHVHLSVRKGDQVVDPFNPDGSAACGASEAALWDQPLNYMAGGLLDIGFHDAIPEFSELKTGLADPSTLGRQSGALILWAYMYGGMAGDQIQFDISGPAGWNFQDTSTLAENQAELFRATGKRQPDGGWPEGEVTGTVTVLREGDVLSQDQIRVTVD